PERRPDDALRRRRAAGGHWKAPLHLRGARRRRRADRDRQGSDPRLADVPNIRLHPRTRLPRGLVREVDQRKRETLAAAGRLLRRRLRNCPLTSTALEDSRALWICAARRRGYGSLSRTARAPLWRLSPPSRGGVLELAIIDLW